MNISNVIGWKFNHQEGMKCKEVNGVLAIVDFPGGIPSQAYQDLWTQEYAEHLGQPTKIKGIEFEGVMCSATSEDMWGLASVKPWIQSGNDVNFVFSNGNKLVLTSTNITAFEIVWTPFRASFF